METLIVHPENKSPYDPEFIEMIKKGDEYFKADKGAIVDVDNLWK